MIRGYSFIIVWVNLIVASTVADDTAENSTTGIDAKLEIKEKALKKITQNLRGDFVFEHNIVRSSTDPTATNMVYMVWSLKLEKIAKETVLECANKESLNDGELKELSKFFSSGGMNAWHGPAGESLNASEVVGSWAVEKDYFDYKHLGCQIGRVCIHYAQIVWATASHVGCALNFCDSFTDQAQNIWYNHHHLICVYGEGGTKMTLEGEYKRPYREGNQSCGRCPTGFSGCRSGLCDTEPPCETVVDCAKISISVLCLCDESVYSRGQRSIVPLWTTLKTVTISVIFMLWFQSSPRQLDRWPHVSFIPS